MSAEEEIQTMFGYWVNKVLAFFRRDKKENWSNYYEQIKRRKNNLKH
jgi:hypothetical protein